MPPIGETLREARLRQRLDISAVEERTKIRAKYLRALENEDWGLLPGPTFVKTFLRTYAEMLGVDGHLLVEEFRANHEPREEPELQPMGAAPRRSRARPRRRAPGPPRRGMVAVGVVVMFVGFLLVLGLVGEEEDPSRTEEVATQPSRTQATAGRPTRPRPRPSTPPREVSVRLAPTVPTYACIDSGEGTEIVFEGNLEEARTFKHARGLRLNLGKRSVAVQANGKDVTIAPSPEPVGLEVTRTGTKEIEEGSRPCA